MHFVVSLLCWLCFSFEHNENHEGFQTYCYTEVQGGRGGPSDSFGSEILAKSDFLGSMKDARIFLGLQKK